MVETMAARMCYEANLYMPRQCLAVISEMLDIEKNYLPLSIIVDLHGYNET